MKRLKTSLKLSQAIHLGKSSTAAKNAWYNNVGRLYDRQDEYKLRNILEELREMEYRLEGLDK